VKRDGILLEVQVRTTLQHQWAEAFERAADRFGRGLRYEEDVDYGGHPERGRAVVQRLNAAADLIDNLECGVITATFGPDLAGEVRDAVWHGLEETVKDVRELR
jgi:hypothetical protein